jgi:AAA+ ATPase superfamily predicted ATPase
MTKQIFLIGERVDEHYFINRNDEIHQVIRNILSSPQNQLILGPRRIGKTSFLINVKNSVRDKVIFVDVDCRRVTNVTEFLWLITDSLTKACENKSVAGNLSQKFSEIFKGKITSDMQSISEIGGCFEHMGYTYLQFCEDEISEEMLIVELFKFIEILADEMKKPIVLAFDEYQEIGKLQRYILNQLKIHNPNVIYILSCSSLPTFYQNALHSNTNMHLSINQIHLTPLKKDDVDNYIVSRFKTQNIDVSSSALDKIYKYTDGFPYYIQKLGSILFLEALFAKNTTIDFNDVEIAFASMLNELDCEFEEKYSTYFSKQQQKILKFLSQNRVHRLSEIATEMQTSASSLTTSMKTLNNTMATHKTKKGCYGITDNVFRLWIKKNIL